MGPERSLESGSSCVEGLVALTKKELEDRYDLEPELQNSIDAKRRRESMKDLVLETHWEVSCREWRINNLGNYRKEDGGTETRYVGYRSCVLHIESIVHIA